MVPWEYQAPGFDLGIERLPRGRQAELPRREACRPQGGRFDGMAAQHHRIHQSARRLSAKRFGSSP
jgi:hypothetical protein